MNPGIEVLLNAQAKLAQTAEPPFPLAIFGVQGIAVAWGWSVTDKAAGERATEIWHRAVLEHARSPPKSELLTLLKWATTVSQ